MRFVLPPLRRPRHPLARALSLLAGLAVIGVLLVFGLFVGAVLLVGGGVLLALRQWGGGKRNTAPTAAGPAQNRGPARTNEVLEGEFVVIQQRGPLAR